MGTEGIVTWGQDQWATLGYPLPPNASTKERERWGSMDPSEQARAWWLLMTHGNMSDTSTEAELQAFIVGRLKKNAAP